MPQLVIVESPAKAKMISRFLGKDYLVKASMGHIRDLPKSKTGVDTEHGFAPTYEISPDKKKIVAELKKDSKGSPKIWIATDEDREGEAIGWHLCEALGLDSKKVERIVFHEITKTAILAALDHPRKIDQNLVDAQQARRVLDRLVGYELSPLLWKKVYAGLSAGRVQSVAVRIIVEREREIRAFVPEEYWRVVADFSKPKFAAELVKIDGQILRPKNKPALIGSEKSAREVEKDLDKVEFKIHSLEKNLAERVSAPPFTTSTLQQEASRKLGFSVKQTMTLAQKLYEGSDLKLKGHTGGLITYMRTDSVNLAAQALSQAQEVIRSKYGKEYTLEKPRYYKNKSKGAQEAHEAIRPVDLSILPESIRDQFDDTKIWKLYKLIWDRTIACQMAPAKLERTTVHVLATGQSKKVYDFEAKGEVVKFPGFLSVYSEGHDEDEEGEGGEKMLPKLKDGEVCDLKELQTTQNFTLPPARYTEASLVKKLEAEGIGRPSTYAPTISTIQMRGYVERNDDRKLVPTDTGEIVTDFLVEHFPQIADYKFTAKIEEEFDEIAEGDRKWEQVMKDFYTPFHATVLEKTESVTRGEAAQARVIGQDPESGREVSVRIGRFGPFVQIGTKDEEEKPRFASIPKGTAMGDINFEQAMKLFDLPRKLTSSTGEEMIVNRGRFGPYVQVDKEYFTIRDKDCDLLKMTSEDAEEVVRSERERKAKAKLASFPDEDIFVIQGPFGAYIKHNKLNYKIPKDRKDTAKDLTLAECQDIIAKGPAPRRRVPRKK